MQDTLLMVFTGILAFAVLVQTILLFGMFRVIRQMSVWVDGVGKDLMRNVELISSKVDEGLTAVRGVTEGVKPILGNLSQTAEVIHSRVVEVDAFLVDATNTARLEIARVQETIHSATERAQQIIETLHESILTPLSEFGAISRGIRVGVGALFRKRRNPSRSAQDEEMFI